MTVSWVWAGAVTPDSVWVRGKVSGASIRLGVATSIDSGTGQLVSPTWIGPTAPASGIVSISATGLAPDTRYWWGLEEDSATVDVNAVGTFKTHPAVGQPYSFTIGVGGCAGGETATIPPSQYTTDNVSNHPVFDTIRLKAQEEDWLFFAHEGDLHYRNINVNDPVQFRDAFDDVLTYNGTLGLNARQGMLYRSMPIVYGWDDHDYGANNSDTNSPSKPAAQQVYRESVPHYQLDSPSGAVYQAFQVGRVQFILSDNRSLRDESIGVGVGAEQISWIEQVLAASTAEVLCWFHPAVWFYNTAERESIADMFASAGYLDRMFMVTVDMHGLGFDTSCSALNRPQFVFGSLDSPPGNADPDYLFDLGTSHGRGRFGTLTFDDDGQRITVTARGYINDIED